MDAHPIAISKVWPALIRARLPILTVALTYLVGLLIGIGMVQMGSQFALNTRDSLVSRANASDPAAIANNSGDHLKAALIDFGSNLVLGAVPSTLGGLGVVIPYPIFAYRGWVGGIVSVDGSHKSRLSQPSTAIYYLITLILQLIPYSLAGGAGVHLGISYFRLRSNRQEAKWLGLPKNVVLDVVNIYLLVIPLFLIASLWEFFF